MNGAEKTGNQHVQNVIRSCTDSTADDSRSSEQSPKELGEVCYRKFATGGAL